MKRAKKIMRNIGIGLILFMLFNAFNIYHYSSNYSETKCDVGIVLGAGTNKGSLSPVFKERINHAIYLYENQYIRKIIFTGGIGSGQEISDSRIAQRYAIQKGIPSTDIRIEERSKYTYENLSEAKHIMDSCAFSSALIISDPLHMKRAMELAVSAKINGYPSPTKTSMYRTAVPRFKLLMYETFFYTFGKLTFQH